MTTIRVRDLQAGDLIAIRVELEGDEPEQAIDAIVRSIGREDEITLRLAVGTDDRGPGRPIEKRIDLTLQPDDDIELIARERVLAKANYRFASGGEIDALWPVTIEVVERGVARYFRMVGALENDQEIEINGVAGLEAILPPVEDGGEIGYLMARASLIAQYEAISR